MCVCVCTRIGKYMLYKLHHGKKRAGKLSSLNLQRWLDADLSPVNNTLNRSQNVFSNAPGLGAYYRSPARNKFFLGSLTDKRLPLGAPAQPFNTLSLRAQSWPGSSIPRGCRVREDLAPRIPTRAAANAQKGPPCCFFQSSAFQPSRDSQPWRC